MEGGFTSGVETATQRAIVLAYIVPAVAQTHRIQIALTRSLMSNRRRGRGHRNGFSLLEMLIVVSVLGIVLAIALPSYGRFASNQRALAASHLLASDLRVAQQEAVTRRAEVSVAFSVADPVCSGHPASYVLGEPEALIKRVCLPPDIDWAPRPAQPVGFQPAGSAEGDATVTVQSARTGKRFTVTVAAG